MPKSQLLDRPVILDIPAKPLEETPKKDYLGMIFLGLFMVVFFTTFFKLIDYETTHDFKWLMRDIKIDPSWY